MKITENIQGGIPIITPPFLINKVCADKKIGVETIQKWQSDQYTSYLLCSSCRVLSTVYLIVTVGMAKKLKHVDKRKSCVLYILFFDEHLNLTLDEKYTFIRRCHKLKI